MKVLSGKSCHLMVEILIVEGHTLIREYLRSVLERLGHKVTEARDGAEGLELARLKPPAIVFIDTLMPTMDGHEFVSALRSQPGQSTLPVIFWTANFAACCTVSGRELPVFCTRSGQANHSRKSEGCPRSTEYG